MSRGRPPRPLSRITLVPQPEPTREPLPLYYDTTPIVGWRIWRVESAPRIPRVEIAPLTSLSLLRLPDVYRLCSIGKPCVWEPCERLHARHLPPNASPTHRAPWPDGNCRCGIWAFKTKHAAEEALANYLRAGDVFAIGTVKLWGSVVEHENGWRGEYAYPATLELAGHCVPDQIVHTAAAALAADYRIPARPLDTRFVDGILDAHDTRLLAARRLIKVRTQLIRLVACNTALAICATGLTVVAGGLARTMSAVAAGIGTGAAITGYHRFYRSR